MDVARPDIGRRKKLRRGFYVVLTAVVIFLITVAVSRLEPAAPLVDRDSLYVDIVRRGAMVREVRAVGTLVTEHIRWIPATTAGIVQRIAIQPGAVVGPETIIVELSNPELEQMALEAKLNLDAAGARYSNRRVEVERSLLEQRATLASTEAQLVDARLQADADRELAALGLISSIQLQQSQAREEEMETRYTLEQERLELAITTVDAQLAVEQAEVDRLRTLHELRLQQVEDLNVQAGMHGVLQRVPLDEGQRVTAGTNLARVGDPRVLKAELRVAETQARDIQIGQKALIDTRNEVVAGHVTRIDPAVENGTVRVDVALEGELPRGARPDLTVDGKIELERLEDILFVSRPVFGREKSVVGLFKVEADNRHAVRTRVTLGRSSVNTIEVLEGVELGDRVVLSDMSTWDHFDRVRIQ